MYTKSFSADKTEMSLHLKVDRPSVDLACLCSLFIVIKKLRLKSSDNETYVRHPSNSCGRVTTQREQKT